MQKNVSKSAVATSTCPPRNVQALVKPTSSRLACTPHHQDTATAGSKLLCSRLAEVWKHWLVRSGQCRGRCFGNPLPCLCCHGRLHLRIPKRFHPIFISIRLTVRSRNDMTKAVLVKFIEHAMRAAKFRQEAADRLISRNWRMLYGNVYAVKRTG